MGIKEVLKQAALQVVTEKPKYKITWKSRGRWRTFTFKEGAVRLTRFARQPKDAHVVKSYVKAIEKASEVWAIPINSQGKLATPPVVEPVISRAEYHRQNINLLRYRQPVRLTYRMRRITPRTPRLRK